MNGTLEHVVKHSVIYSYLLSQPFSVYIDAYPVRENKVLLEAEQMSYGNHGEIVRVLQKKLTTLAYYEDNIDGHYGLYTEKALKNFQEDHNILTTGQTNIKTITTLIEEEYKMHMERLESLSESVKPDMHGENVKIVQEALQFFGYYDGEIDGINGPLTKRALQIAEEEHGIILSEEITKEILASLLEIEQFEEVNFFREEQFSKLKELSRLIHFGMKNENVKIVQEVLNYFDLYDDEIDGSYGPLTKEGLQLAEKKFKVTLIHEPETPNDHQVVTESKHNEQQTGNIKDEQKEQSVVQVKKVESKQSNHSNVIETARSYIGTPYVWGGTSPNGFDCSGFVQFAYQSANVTIPRTVSDIWNFGQSVSQPSIGDLVFFETYKAGPSHLGIYLGDGKFIHAGQSRGVEIAELNGSYWKQRYIGAKRISN